MCTGVEIALLTTAIVGTTTATVGALKAGKAAKAGEQARARLEAIRSQRERTDQIRQARIRRAEIVQAGENAGVSESSSVQSGAAGVFGQAFSNISYINQQESAGKAMSNARQDGHDAQGLIALGQGMSDIAGTAFTYRSVFTKPDVAAPKVRDVFTQGSGHEMDAIF